MEPPVSDAVAAGASCAATAAAEPPEEPIAETVTDDQGKFQFERHDQHRVVLTAKKPGVGESNRRGVRLYFKNQNRELDTPLLLSP